MCVCVREREGGSPLFLFSSSKTLYTKGQTPGESYYDLLDISYGPLSWITSNFILHPSTFISSFGLHLSSVDFISPASFITVLLGLSHLSEGLLNCLISVCSLYIPLFTHHCLFLGYPFTSLHIPLASFGFHHSLPLITL